jgi:hypothetical protein
MSGGKGVCGFDLTSSVALLLGAIPLSAGLIGHTRLLCGFLPMAAAAFSAVRRA